MERVWDNRLTDRQDKYFLSVFPCFSWEWNKYKKSMYGYYHAWAFCVQKTGVGNKTVTQLVTELK